MTEQLLYAARARFESARRIEEAPVAARLRRLHGHSFEASVRVGAPLAQEHGSPLAPFAGAEIDALRERLADCVAPLDYQLLNEVLAAPTDERLAHWLRARLQLQGIERVGVQSTSSQGLHLDSRQRAHIWRRYQFEAAHQLPRVAPGHKCGRMHGHGFGVLLYAQSAAEPQGLDGAGLDRLWAPLQKQLHHACLNEIAGLENPTSECIARWIWDRIAPQLPGLTAVRVQETLTSGAHFDGEGYRIWKEFGLDSAVRLRNAPQADGRARVHGHTYRLRLHLSAALDTVYGWIIDFGDVKELFAPVFALLDHQPLHELPLVAEAGASAIARWVRAQAAPRLPQLQRVDLYETCGCGVILAWSPQR